MVSVIRLGGIQTAFSTETVMSHSSFQPVAARSLVLLGVCCAAVVLPLSFSAGAIATPAIGRALGGGPVALNWITNAFMLAFGSCLMAAGALDRKSVV